MTSSFVSHLIVIIEKLSEQKSFLSFFDVKMMSLSSNLIALIRSLQTIAQTLASPVEINGMPGVV